jgi:hypothetical protein
VKTESVFQLSKIKHYVTHYKSIRYDFREPA